MLDLDRAFFPFQQAFQVHQTGHVSSCDDLNPLMLMVTDPVLAHPYRHCLFKDGKCTPEATAFIFPGKGDQIDFLHLFQQASWLVKIRSHNFRRLSQSETSQAVTTGVNTYFMRKGSMNFLYF